VAFGLRPAAPRVTAAPGKKHYRLEDAGVKLDVYLTPRAGTDTWHVAILLDTRCLAGRRSGPATLTAAQRIFRHLVDG
jgi:hypothetical protein